MRTERLISELVQAALSTPDNDEPPEDPDFTKRLRQPSVMSTGTGLQGSTVRCESDRVDTVTGVISGLDEGRGDDSVGCLIREIFEQRPKNLTDLQIALEDQRSTVLIGEWKKLDGRAHGSWSVTLDDGSIIQLTLSSAEHQNVKNKLRIGVATTKIAFDVICRNPYKELYLKKIATIRGSDLEAIQKIKAAQKKALDIVNARFGLDAQEFDFSFT